MKNIINQLFEIEAKLNGDTAKSVQRNFERLYHELEQMGYKVVNPLGQKYDERDISIEANVLTNSNNAKIVKVLKPAIYQKIDETYTLVQKAIVIAE